MVLFGLTSLGSLDGARAEGPGVVVEQKGTFELLTYNVAGLPEGLSRSRPLVNLPRIGKLLNKYDIALVQEDFAYPLELRREARHAHVSPAFVRQWLDFGDGLSQFTRLPFSEFRRVPWSSCHGLLDAFFDCLTPKGFTRARQSLAEDVSIDVYNLHMDAGGAPGDREARQAQVAQLISAIQADSAGRALVVGGDTNMFGRDQALLERLLDATELRDACSEVQCGDPRVDRVLYRSSRGLRLGVKKWRIDRDFVDAQGRPLSDHLPVAVAFDWQRRPEQEASVTHAGTVAIDLSR
jgi:endonuclease/exonuclease/phosphatase family metal-dependent hydrolase